MRHIKTLTRSKKPALAGGGPTICDCFSVLFSQGDIKSFVDCMDCKFTKC